MIEKNAGKGAELAPMITDLFAQDTSGSDYATEAKADIWADYADFSPPAATTTCRAVDLVAATAAGRAATTEAVGALGSSCKRGHARYRQKK